jgi:hypothetical protein
MPAPSARFQQLKRHRILTITLLLLGLLVIASEFLADRQIVINASPSVPPGL